MDALSPEVQWLIISNLSGKLAPFASISRSWQFAIERRTMRRIAVRSSEWADFAAVFSQPHRHHLLRSLHLRIGMPTHGDTRRDHKENQLAFRNAVATVLHHLGAWEEGLQHDTLTELELTLSWYWEIDPTGMAGGGFDVCNSAAARRYFTLTEDDVVKLASVRRISSLRTIAAMGRVAHPLTMCQIATQFPHLQSLCLELWDPAVKRRELRAEHRSGLADGILLLCDRLPHLQQLNITRQNGHNPDNHSFECQDFTDEMGVDKLSEALRGLGKAGVLRNLELDYIPITADLFCNRRPGNEGEVPKWPSLRSFHIWSTVVAADGKWLYTGSASADDEGSVSEGTDLEDGEDSEDDESEDDEEGYDGEDAASAAASDRDEDRYEKDAAVNGQKPRHAWRKMPDKEVFDPMIEGMMTAVADGMPCLGQFCLDINPVSDLASRVVMQGAASGQEYLVNMDWNRAVQDDDTSLPRFKTWVGKAAMSWEPSSAALDKARQWVGERGMVETTMNTMR